ncbi:MULTISPECIES: hypothetical protein [Dickeya]|uniref:hypothetical protein n=1 Tax=Dickeya TaxID=204037 RepID=UPI00055418CD|nr:MULTISPECIES: hypothetical protein [Dickeya]
MNRRSFIISGIALGLYSITHQTYSALTKKNIIINTILINDEQKIIDRLDKFLFKKGQCVFSDSKDRIPVKFVLRFFEKNTMKPLIGAKVGICLSDAFKAIGKTPSTNNTCNATWAEVTEENYIEFSTYVPKITLKKDRFMNPIDFIIRKEDKFSISRINFSNDFLQTRRDLHKEVKNGVYTQTLTDRAIEISGQSIDSSVVELTPEMARGYFHVAIDFIVDGINL